MVIHAVAVVAVLVDVADLVDLVDLEAVGRVDAKEDVLVIAADATAVVDA